ncbi:MAG: prolyl oligopeptidase family serine peptidase [Opitutales bacterium]
MIKTASLSFALLVFFLFGAGSGIFPGAAAAEKTSTTKPTERPYSYQPVSMDLNQNAHSLQRNIAKTINIDYLLFVPRDYDPAKGEKWPMILFLHGAGERGSDLDRVTVHGPPKIVKENPDFPFVLVSPQCPEGETWNIEVLVALLDKVIEQNTVDPARIYLTGMSMGGFGAWELGLTHPEKFAAIAPVCGGGNAILLALHSPERAEAMRTLPVWAFHGANDAVVPLSESERMIEGLRRYGATEVNLTVYPEAGHDSWTETYSNQELYDWFLEHKRD